MISDKTTRIFELRERVSNFIEDRDWNKYHNPKDIAISITIEASELLEVFQWVEDKDLDNTIKEPTKIARLEEELADVMIYCFSLANAVNIDIARAVMSKIEKNERKYPAEQVKGDYRKYTELKNRIDS